jgi:glutamate N-acetyltransferase/amino-acid N-acetyltransferase
MKPPFTPVKGSVTAAKGFKAGGLAAGIKGGSKKDLALIVSDPPANMAAVFTTNQVKAAPVRVCLAHMSAERTRAIIANSGNANACTGEVGMLHAHAMAAAVARRLGCDDQQVLVCSTGRIGVLLPIVKVEAGIKRLLRRLTPAGAADAAQAIMTSDTFPKQIAVRLRLQGRTVHVGGIAKGAGMIQPNMATMLAFLTTDALVPRAALQQALNLAVGLSFNRLSVDGDTSTNDTVILLANGAAATPPISGGAALRLFQDALNFVCIELAKMIVRDGEGASRFVTVTVSGAESNRDAERAARAVANSSLVKTSWAGADANWGRLMAAIGYSGAVVQESRVSIAYDGIVAVRDGVAVNPWPARVNKIVRGAAFEIRIDLGLGDGVYSMHTCDLTEQYVRLNLGE